MRTGTPLTGRQIHALVSDDHSLWNVQQGLKALTMLGLIHTHTVGRAGVPEVTGMPRPPVPGAGAEGSVTARAVNRTTSRVADAGALQPRLAGRGGDSQLTVIPPALKTGFRNSAFI